MKTRVQVNNEDDSMSIAKTSGDYDYHIYKYDDLILSLSEDKLRELKVMIEEILESANKRDW